MEREGEVWGFILATAYELRSPQETRETRDPTKNVKGRNDQRITLIDRARLISRVIRRCNLAEIPVTRRG